MQAIERPFNSENLSQLENLTAVTGYLRGELFEISTYESGVVPEPVLNYIHYLQQTNDLSNEPDMSDAVVNMLNSLLVDKKYSDPVYIRVLHDWLRPLRYDLPLSEYQNKQYGVGTTAAVRNFQKAELLPITGTVDLATEQALQEAYSKAFYFVKGQLHDANWTALSGATIEVWEKSLRGAGAFLQSATTDAQGSYELSFSPPTDTDTGLFVEEVHLLIRIKNNEGTLLLEEAIYHAAPVTWINYTAGEQPYRGESVYTGVVNQLTPYLEGIPIHQLEESDQHQDVTYLYQKTGVPIQTILQLYFAERVALEWSEVPASVLFAFFRQHLPSMLPSYLLPDEPNEWNNWSENLTETLTSAVPLMHVELQQRALERAIQNNVIPLADQQNKTAILQRLDELRLEYAKQSPLIAGSLSLNELLKETGLNLAQKDSLAIAFAKTQRLDAPTIEKWYEEALISEEERQKVEQELQLAALGIYDTAVIQRLREGYDLEGFSAFVYQVSDFAKWTYQDWENLDFDPDDPTGDLVQRSAALAPTVAAIAALQRDGEHELEHLNTLATLVDEQQLLSLQGVPIDTYLQEKGLELSQAVINELKLIQRVQHLAPRADLVPTLLGARIHSAYQAHRLGKAQLEQMYTLAGVDTSLAPIYAARTATIAANTLSTLAGVSASYGLLGGGGITPASITPLPNLEDLFGNNDFCGCVHCRSVYSPAAYLTDLLHWLESKPDKTGNQSALELLLERRPDLEHILLNCKNANTPMPYIDLVAEVLEYAISPTTSYEKRNTTWQAAELKARSEYRLDAVYERFAQLPSASNYRPYASYNGFNIWQTQVHLFLEKLGITSSQFTELLSPPNLGYLERAAATFELPSHEAVAITTPHADVDQLTSPNRNVAALLHDHQLSYEELLMLLQGEYTNSGKAMSIEPEGSCDLDALLIANMTAVELDRWWRFLRLWKYTNWTIWELDHLIMHPKVGNGILNSYGLERLATFYRLQKRLGRKTYEILGMMGDLDTSGRYNSDGDLVPSFYESIFYNRLLDDSQRVFFDKNNLTLQLALGSITSGQIAYLAAALSMTSTQIETLLTFPQQGQWTQVIPQRIHQLSAAQEGLGLLYAYANLAKYLRLSVEELKNYLRLLIDIADPMAGLNELEAFLDNYEALRASGINARELLFLLSGSALEGYQPSETKIHKWQDDLYEEVGTAYDKAMIAKQTEEEVLQDLLKQTGTFETQEVVETFLEVLYQTTDGRFTNNWTTSDRSNYLNTDLTLLFAYTDSAALDQLKEDLDLTNGSISAAIATIKVILHRRLHSAVVVNYLADLWEAPTDVLAYLLDDAHPTLGQAARHRLMEAPPVGNAGTAHPIATVATGSSVPTSSTPPAPASFTTIYRRLLKYVFWAKAWRLSGADLEQLETAAANLPALTVATLPLSNSGNTVSYTAIPQVMEYLNTAQWVRFAQQYNIPIADLVKAILTLDTTSDTNDFLEAIAAWTGWEVDDLTAMHQHFQWTPTNYMTELGHWQHWNQTMQLLQQLRVSAGEALGWLSLYDTSNSNYFAQQRLIAQQIQNAVRQASTPKQWLLIQQEIQDQIRLQKRDALVAYARNYDAQGNRVYYSTEDLYHLHLIDPQMSACQLTSRIKQAISAVQLYVQRCRLGLEQDYIQVTENDGWAQWEWMQNYRVWEANRKVFLYPENWIEPSLRDNKSELFKQFEGEVLQQEVTSKHIETALQNYLVRLNEIANLEIMSLARESSTNKNVTHFLARTREHPAIYYYRNVDNDTMQWTGWEKLSFDIQGEHPVLQIYNNRLHVFWLQIIEQPEKLVVSHQDTIGEVNSGTDTLGRITIASSSSSSSSSSSEANPSAASRELPNYKNIQLAWSVLNYDGWSTQKISKKKLIHPWPRPDYALHLRPRHKGSDIWVDLYVSPSPEFNNNVFYNQFEDKYETMTDTRYDSSISPVAWHSSSFVFDGFVREVKLFAVAGSYWTKQLIGSPTTTTIEKWDENAPLWIDEIQEDANSNVEYITNLGKFKQYVSSEKSDLLKIINENLDLGRAEDYVKDISCQYDDTAQAHKITLHVKYWINNYYSAWLVHNIDEWNNVFANGDMYNSAVRPWINTSTTSYGSVNTQGATYIKMNNRMFDSYQHVYHNYGQDGRVINQLLDSEHAGDLPIISGARYSFNKIIPTIKRESGIIAPLTDTEHGTEFSPFMQAGSYREGYELTVPMEDTFYRSQLGNYFTVASSSYNTFYVKGNRTQNTAYLLYHPLARRVQQVLTSQGKAALYDRSLQYEKGDSISNNYTIISTVFEDSVEHINFNLHDGYALYNWEVFFHIPFLVATELSKNQRFEEAMGWFHCIFNPLGVDATNGTLSPASDVSRYWITKPFYERTQTDYLVQQIQNLLSGVLSDTTQRAIAQWKKHPFQPHVIARMRSVAYQKAVVMKYIDNLLAWGDQLFRQETLESINQAGLMYTLAAELLGDRPKTVESKTATDLDYKEIKADLDDYLSNTVLNDNLVISILQSNAVLPNDSDPIPSYSLPNNTQYFCIPHNEKLLGYWDMVADRLFKIRHCMNIDGRVRQLPLFAPPIDPALLVSAVANGVDINSVLQDLATPKSDYKYRPLSRLATQFCSEVKALGQSLLSALQSRDAEGMALLQTGNATKVLNASIGLKKLQIEEAQENILSLEQSKQAALHRQNFYGNRSYISWQESVALSKNKEALGLSHTAAAIQSITTGVVGIPDVQASVGIAAALTTEVVNGTKLAYALTLASNITDRALNIINQEAGLIATKANYDRRQEEWDFQAELAKRDIEQIEQQIAAAKIRVAIAEKDLVVHKKQIDNAETELAYLQSKYTNQQLYSWMVGQLSKIYRQAYDLAFDIAKRAEKSLNYELGLPLETPRIIQHGYWDSLRKGLLAGDQLMLALHQLEDKYVQLNKRELELTKHLSLHQWAPDALLQLKTTGKCQLHIPEWWFDLDYPGHYLRRIKALTISIPCVVGPNTNVNCKVTLSRHALRRESIIKGADYADALNFDQRYDSHTMATSSGQNDAGVFELNFNDERFLPFEGLGVISTWELQLPDYAQFAYKSISDVVFHMRYTAREAGSVTVNAAKAHLRTQLATAASQEPPSILISAQEAFPTAWHLFKYPNSDSTATPYGLDLDIHQYLYPYFTSLLGTPKIVGGMVGVVRNADSPATTVNLSIKAPSVTNPVASVPITIDTNTHYGTHDLGLIDESGIDTWTITAATSTDAQAIENIYFLLVYQLPV